MNLEDKENTLFSCLYNYFVYFKKIIKSTFFYPLLLVFIFLCVFYLKIKTPFIGDDYVYSFIFTTSTKLENFTDVINSQIIHYYAWGGRSIVHLILQVVLLINNPIIISALNSIVFILFILGVQFHIIGKVKCNTEITFIVFCLVCLLQPAFGETCLWLTGSVNYLWGTTIILYFLLPYRLFINKQKETKHSLLPIVAMFIGGVLTGWTNENTVAGLIIILLLLLIYMKKQKQSIPLWAYFGFLGVLIGYIIMIVAPGNFIRAAEAGTPTTLVLLFRLFSYTQLFIAYLSVLNLGLVFTLILYLRFNTNNKNQYLIIALVYLLGVFASIYSMILSPSFPPRAWFGVITFNIIAFGTIFYHLNYNFKFLRIIKICFTFFCIINVFFSLYEGVKDITEINKIWNKRLIEISENRNSSGEFTFKKYKAKTKFGLSDAPYANKYISNYYGIKFELTDQ